MKRWLGLGVLVCATATAQQAPIPSSDEIGGRPFAIRDKWVIGGTGNWDYMALDPVARQLFITHQTSVQAVDIGTGQLAGEIPGFTEARSVILDSAGQFGYVSDGRANEIKVFNRRSLSVETTISLTCSPRSLTLAEQQEILVAVCGSPTPLQPVSVRRPPNHRPGQAAPPSQTPVRGDSQIAFIDTETDAVLAYISAPGDFRIARAGNDGQVFVTVGPAERIVDPRTGARESWPQRVAHLDAVTIVADARRTTASQPIGSGSPAGLPPVHWSSQTDRDDRYLDFLPLPSTCPGPQGLAVDSHDFRLFIACDNQNMLVLDSVRGRVIDTLTTGPGTDAIVYDESRGLIFTANGGGYGSVTIIRQHLSDSYAVIQSLPTMERAHTLALDSSTGSVYLVTDVHGAKLDNPPSNGIGKLKLEPVDGSFQVLVVGN